MDGNGAVSGTPLTIIKNGFDAEKVALVIFIQTPLFAFLAGKKM